MADVMRRLAPGTRPSLLAGRKAFAYFPGETRYSGGSFAPLERGGTLTVRLNVQAAEADGTVFQQGDVVGGMGLFLDRGTPRFVYNPAGRPQERLILTGAGPLAPGAHSITIAVTPESGPRAAKIGLIVDGKPAASGAAPIYYIARGEAYVGRPGVRHLLPGGDDARPAGFSVERLEVVRP
jgi:arylsulfatase